MADKDKKKDVWDKIGSITPLVLGIAVTGIGAIFTHIYNVRQLQLNQIAALEKLRPLLTSDKPEDREFGYASFVALGYEEMAIRIVQIKKDESGRSVLVELKRVGTPQVQTNARDALMTLDVARGLVMRGETGDVSPNKTLLSAHPELTTALQQGEKWAQEAARELGISSKLGIGILNDTATHIGTSRASKLKELASIAVLAPLNSREKEAAWLNAFLDNRDKASQQGLSAKLSAGG